jgi:dolichyl-diphosphooligosaccharide--protein glycosyltransferase
MERGSRPDADLIRPPYGWLFAIFAAGLLLRVVFSYAMVVQPARINFQDNDAWYHMRRIDSLAAHWPHALRMDPYAIAGGEYVAVAPLFDVVVSGVAVAAGLGSPSTRTLELTAAWAPAVMGALIALPLYAAGARLFGRRAALLAAALVAVLPGHLLERTRLGFVDHHAAEALLSAVLLWLLVRGAQQTTTREQAIAGAWSGVALGAYLLTWASGAFLVAIVCVWLIAQYMIDAVRGTLSSMPAAVAASAALVALAIVLLCQDPHLFGFEFQVIALVGTIAIAAGFEAVRIAIVRAGGAPVILAVTATMAALLAAAVAPAIAPGISGAVASQVQRLVPDASAYTVMEAMPLVSFVTAPWMTRNPFLVFGTGLPLGAIGLTMLAVALVPRPRPELLLLFVWTVIVFISTMLRNRFGYYFVPLLALLGGWVCAEVRERLGERRRDLAAALIGALAFAPNIWPARAQVRVNAGVTPEWVAALDWLRTSTPEPFGDPNYYFARYDPAAAAPEPHATVMAWWDYGYWIVRAAHRVPVANPTQLGAEFAGRFLTETDPEKARALLRGSRAETVVVDWQLPLRIVPPPTYVLGKFETLAQWGGRKVSDYYELMFVRDDQGRLLPALVFYPAYYESMAIRLYQFRGRSVAPVHPAVMTYADRRGADGSAYREVTEMRILSTSSEAEAYLASLGPGPHRLVGLQPNEPPVAMDGLPDFEPVWASAQPGPWPGTPALSVFRWSPATHAN